MKKGGKALDLAAGTGDLTLGMARQVGAEEYGHLQQYLFRGVGGPRSQTEGEGSGGYGGG